MKKTQAHEEATVCCALSTEQRRSGGGQERERQREVGVEKKMSFSPASPHSPLFFPFASEALVFSPSTNQGTSALSLLLALPPPCLPLDVKRTSHSRNSPRWMRNQRSRARSREAGGQLHAAAKQQGPLGLMSIFRIEWLRRFFFFCLSTSISFCAPCPFSLRSASSDPRFRQLKRLDLVSPRRGTDGRWK